MYPPWAPTRATDDTGEDHGRVPPRFWRDAGQAGHIGHRSRSLAERACQSSVQWWFCGLFSEESDLSGTADRGGPTEVGHEYGWAL